MKGCLTFILGYGVYIGAIYLFAVLNNNMRVLLVIGVVLYIAIAYYKGERKEKKAKISRDITAKKAAEERRKYLEEHKNSSYEDNGDLFQDYDDTEERHIIKKKKAIAELEWYWKKKKSNQEIGRDYERYIGYTYEKSGYTVDYRGITQGLHDEGIDLVCKKSGETILVQCKYWAKDKTIYEKHLTQLGGTTSDYKIENPNERNVKAMFITNIELSDTASKIASNLNIEVKENTPLDKTYACIKCNINSKGEKIYHLPSDGQYDRTKIVKAGEFYASSVEEAERYGFRRSYQ